MTNFKTGDNVLVTINGVDVPAVVEYAGSDYSDIGVNGIRRSFDTKYMRPDPSKRKWAVRDVVETAAELTTLPDNAVFVDALNVVMERDMNLIWIFGDENDYASDYPTYPVTIIYVPKDV